MSQLLRITSSFHMRKKKRPEDPKAVSRPLHHCSLSQPFERKKFCNVLALNADYKWTREAASHISFYILYSSFCTYSTGPWGFQLESLHSWWLCYCCRFWMIQRRTTFTWVRRPYFLCPNLPLYFCPLPVFGTYATNKCSCNLFIIQIVSCFLPHHLRAHTLCRNLPSAVPGHS